MVPTRRSSCVSVLNSYRIGGVVSNRCLDSLGCERGLGASVHAFPVVIFPRLIESSLNLDAYDSTYILLELRLIAVIHQISRFGEGFWW